MSGRRLTVVQLLPELDVGGVERGTLEIARALVERGHRAIVVSAPGRLVGQLEAFGAEHVPIAIGAKSPRVLACVSRLAALYERTGADIVHARSRLPAWIGWLARARIAAARRPVWVTTVHGPYTVNRYSRIMASGEAVIAISAFIREYVLKAWPHVPSGRIEVIPRGVDPQAFPYGHQPGAAWRAAFERAVPQARDRTLIVLPARLTRWKGQLDFIALIATLRGRGRPVHGLIAGAPHPRKRAFEQTLRAEVERRGLDADVTFLGHRDDLREVLAVSDFACSLTGEPEAFGRTTVEALSLGTPVVGYAHGGTAEILEAVYPDGLVAPGDVAGAAARIEALMGAPRPVPREQPFTLARMQAATVALYERLASNRGGR